MNSKQINPQAEKMLNEQISKMSNEEIKALAKKERTTFITGGIILSIILFALCAAGIFILVTQPMQTNMIFTCIFTGGFGIYFVFLTFKNCLQSDRVLAMENLKRHIKKISSRQNMSENHIFENFTTSKSVSLNISNWYQSLLLIDDTKKQFIIQKGRQYSEVYNFADVLSYEVFENGQSKVQGRTGSALIGGAFFGLGGAIVGSSRNRSINEKCTHLTLIIRINNLYSPQIELVFFNNVSVDKSSVVYKTKIDNIRLVCSHLEYIINAKKLEESPKQEQSSNIENKPSKKEQLQELKEMLDGDLITQEDYEQKKKQILGL